MRLTYLGISEQTHKQLYFDDEAFAQQTQMHPDALRFPLTTLWPLPFDPVSINPIRPSKQDTPANPATPSL